VKPVASLSELQMEFRRIQSVATDTDRWLCKAFMFLIERGTFGSLRPSRTKRAPSEWSKFFAKGMKAGKSPRQIADEWNTRKNGGEVKI